MILVDSLIQINIRAKNIETCLGEFFHAMSIWNHKQKTHDSDSFAKSEEIFDYTELIVEWTQTGLDLNRRNFSTDELEKLESITNEIEDHLLWLKYFHQAQQFKDEVPIDSIYKSIVNTKYLRGKIGLLKFFQTD